MTKGKNKISLPKVQEAFNSAIKRRDRRCMVRDYEPCCGQLECSHFFSVGSSPALRFYPPNAYTQCQKHHWKHHNKWHRGDIYLEQTGERIKAKVAEIEAAEKLSDDEIAPCLPEERWADPDKYAVMKEGRKTAVRVFDNEENAKLLLKELDEKHFIEHRPAVSRKCADYCLCKDFCNFYQQEIK